MRAVARNWGEAPVLTGSDPRRMSGRARMLAVSHASGDSPPPRADDLYELITERARKPVIITSNRAPADWYPLFPNPVVADPCSTGSLTPADQIVMTGPSYRPTTSGPAPPSASLPRSRPWCKQNKARPPGELPEHHARGMSAAPGRGGTANQREDSRSVDGPPAPGGAVKETPQGADPPGQEEAAVPGRRLPGWPAPTQSWPTQSCLTRRTNPTIFAKAIIGSDSYGPQERDLCTRAVTCGSAVGADHLRRSLGLRRAAAGLRRHRRRGRAVRHLDPERLPLRCQTQSQRPCTRPALAGGGLLSAR